MSALGPRRGLHQPCRANTCRRLSGGRHESPMHGTRGHGQTRWLRSGGRASAPPPSRSALPRVVGTLVIAIGQVDAVAVAGAPGPAGAESCPTGGRERVKARVNVRPWAIHQSCRCGSTEMVSYSGRAHSSCGVTQDRGNQAQFFESWCSPPGPAAGGGELPAQLSSTWSA